MTKEEFLATSLPYELKMYINSKFGDFIFVLTYSNFSNDLRNGVTVDACMNLSAKPILRPLSDLTKTITHKGETFVPMVKLLENNYFDTSKMSIDEIMSYNTAYIDSDFITLNDLPLYLKWHFDIAGLIEKGEAIDVNTLDKNPYE